MQAEGKVSPFGSHWLVDLRTNSTMGNKLVLQDECYKGCYLKYNTLASDLSKLSLFELLQWVSILDRMRDDAAKITCEPTIDFIIIVIVIVIKSMVPSFKTLNSSENLSILIEAAVAKTGYALEQYSNCKLNSWNIMEHVFNK